MPLMPYPPLQLRNLHRSIENRVPQKIWRDVINRLRYGRDAPRSDECLWVDPRRITLAFRPHSVKDQRFRFRRHHSGSVVGGDWDEVVSPLGTHIKHQACFAHFREGVPWSETGLYEHLLERIERFGSYDGLRTLSDIERRYARLDAVAEEARVNGRIRARSELDGKQFRGEHGGAMVHIARDGTPLRAGGGLHRFAISQALELPVMPVQLCVIHPDALNAGVLKEMRVPPDNFPLPGPPSRSNKTPTDP